MAGRPVTNTTRRAQQKRERQRELRESMKVRPVSFNPAPLAKALSAWRTN